ncbi:MAG: hypothetical protein ABSF92_11995 [Candidatus Acidiferrales bacterium]|jgi:hypothetical protein
MPLFRLSFICRWASARIVLSAAALVVLCASAALVRSDDKSGDTIGTIDGEAIAVQGPMSVEVTGGEVRTTLLSGSDVRVKFGRATIQLREGGVITICGPAHLSLLKSGGALTIALEYGTIHHRVQGAPIVTVYTPLIQAKSISVGDAGVETMIGLAPSGEICLRAHSGAVRIEGQLTGQSVIVPQGGDVVLPDGQIESLRSGAGTCSCELAEARTNPAMQAKPAVVSGVTSSEDISRLSAVKPADPAPPKEPAYEEPIYKVLMPPLSYSASAPPPPASPALPPEPSPATIFLVRTVRVRPTLIFLGHVEAGPADIAGGIHGSAPGPATSSHASGGSRSAAGSRANPSVMSRVRAYLHRLWNHNS